MKLLPPTLLGLLLPAMACADATFYKGRTEYILVTTAATWDLAEADAVSRGGHLVQLNDSAENALVLAKITGKVSTVAADGGGAKYVWIGGWESAEGTYAWAGGTNYWAGGSGGASVGGAFQNWGRLASPLGGPEPDNFAGTQNRAALALEKWPTGASAGQELGVAGQWNDLNGLDQLYYIIERPISKPAEGLFAVFQMTHGGVPAGSFTCQLYYDKAPTAVANFISLAEGTRGWIDPLHGRISNEPYYNGLKCHRIISNFMIQGGDPKGNGTGGPGYRFVDEFQPELRHDHPGVLSMANSGKNSNGSQFFVTVSETPNLNDVHTIFGEVVEGYESCVLPLSHVPTNASDAPLQDVVISSVTIQRLGAAAQAFDPLNPLLGLPVCSMHPVRFERTPAGVMTLLWAEPAHCSYTLLDSADLSAWASKSYDYYSGYAPVATQSLIVTAVPPPGAPRHFFQLAKATYTPLPPAAAQSRRFVLTGTSSGRITTISVTGANDGTHLIQESGGFSLNSTLSNVMWDVPQFDRASFSSDISPAYIKSGYSLTHSDWEFTYRSSTGGSYSGGFYTADHGLVLRESGEFTVSVIP